MDEFVYEVCCAPVVCQPTNFCKTSIARPIHEASHSLWIVKKGAIKDNAGVPIAYGHAEFNETNFAEKLRLAALNCEAYLMPKGTIEWMLPSPVAQRLEKAYAGSPLADIYGYRISDAMISPKATWFEDANQSSWFCQLLKKINEYNFYFLTKSGHLQVIDNALIAGEVMQQSIGSSTNKIWGGSALKLTIDITAGDCPPLSLQPIALDQLAVSEDYPTFTIALSGILSGTVVELNDGCECLHLMVSNDQATKLQFETEELVKCKNWATQVCSGETALPAGFEFANTATTTGNDADNTTGILTIPASLAVGATYKFFVKTSKCCYGGAFCVKVTIID